LKDVEFIVNSSEQRLISFSENASDIGTLSARYQTMLTLWYDHC